MKVTYTKYALFSSIFPIPQLVLKRQSKLMMTRNAQSSLTREWDKLQKQTTCGEELQRNMCQRFTGGNDKQGVLFKGRVRILMRKGHKGYRPRKDGEMKRKSIRGCIVGQDIRVLALQVVKKGANEIAGLTDQNVPRRLGPKRLTKLRRLFGFKKADRVISSEEHGPQRYGKKRQKAPKIQRLVTESRLRRKTIQKKTEQARRTKAKQALEAYKKLAHDVHEAHKKHRKASSEIKEKVKEQPKAKDTKATTKPAQGGKQATQTKAQAPVKAAAPAKTTAPAKTAPAKTAPQPTQKAPTTTTKAKK
ncbi:unnamed protein product (macronuclear) [Paramecium tetraurelia]|uniref:40S ribosomal protein S6 n=1 Tax=Paramecium tetraurelia TaxID=5888 RepID=A0DEZ7_PARTE|nr:uncharacterized protein GSPATT00016440001 [Paramecium tetraurelia]CAK81614.1 unnamed protein product [Paramecium tetraurelia]|eukprot:XP_001449011.1 hypothetical protein (macronuclear) [Paramecium tetraurelia strain d4-2]